MAACVRNCKSWSLAKDAEEHGDAGKVGWARCAEPRFGLSAVATSKDLELGPKGSWA